MTAEPLADDESDPTSDAPAEVGGAAEACYPDDPAGTVTVLANGRIEVVGRISGASNVCLLVDVSLGATTRRAIYKPIAGERPLWDFPTGTLAAREVASFVVSDAAGLDVVPPTALRDDAPFGPGSVQAWVDSDGAEPGQGLVDIFASDAVPGGWLTVLTADGENGDPVVLAHAATGRLRAVALLDVVVNNADRKGGHLLTDRAGRVRGVDHGLTFNTDDKLRTVLWGWAGQSLRQGERARLERLDADLGGDLGERLHALLDTDEIARTRHRVQRVLRAGRLPSPSGHWPPIPWPAF